MKKIWQKIKGWIAPIIAAIVGLFIVTKKDKWQKAKEKEVKQTAKDIVEQKKQADQAAKDYEEAKAKHDKQIDEAKKDTDGTTANDDNIGDLLNELWREAKERRNSGHWRVR